MIRVRMVAVLALIFIGISGRSAGAQDAPFARGVTDDVASPSNDDFDRATVISALPSEDTVDTRGATGAADDPVCDGQCATVWFRYTPDETHTIGATTWGSDYDTRIFVYTGERGALEPVTEIPNYSYRLLVEALTTYHFMVINRTWDLSGGLLRFSLTDQSPFSLGVDMEAVALMDKPSGVITLRGEVTCSSPSQVYVGITLERLLAQRYLRAFGILVLDCAGRTPFELDVQTYSASRFGDYYPPGQYSASVQAYGFDTSRGEAADATIFRLPILVRGAP